MKRQRRQTEITMYFPKIAADPETSPSTSSTARRAASRIKWEQRKVADESNALIDVAKLQSDMHEILFEMQRVQDFLVSKVDMLMRQMEKLEKSMLLGAGAHLKQPTAETV
ncbi:hypothetical protein M513_00024 [Trichuris suis]|uniref:Uncharacterized protein n=1 Tax=Trichuris suis TaxID=68888 RepID=A0A085MNR5_9BILA|nr:hypothetical protein M513_00024 [Trichuris suis]